MKSFFVLFLAGLLITNVNDSNAASKCVGQKSSVKNTASTLKTKKKTSSSLERQIAKNQKSRDKAVEKYARKLATIEAQLDKYRTQLGMCSFSSQIVDMIFKDPNATSLTCTSEAKFGALVGDLLGDLLGNISGGLGCVFSGSSSLFTPLDRTFREPLTGSYGNSGSGSGSGSGSSSSCKNKKGIFDSCPAVKSICSNTVKKRSEFNAVKSLAGKVDAQYATTLTRLGNQKTQADQAVDRAQDAANAAQSAYERCLG